MPFGLIFGLVIYAALPGIIEDHRHMIVSGGLGTSIVPLRLGVPPEIVQVEVRGPSLTVGSD